MVCSKNPVGFFLPWGPNRKGRLISNLEIEHDTVFFTEMVCGQCLGHF